MLQKALIYARVAGVVGNASVLAAVAESMDRSGSSEAVAVFGEAVDCARKIENECDRSVMLATVAAEEVFMEALACMVNFVRGPYHSISLDGLDGGLSVALAAVAEGLGRSGGPEVAAELLKELACNGETVNESSRSYALAAMAKGFLRCGLLAEAFRAIQDLLAYRAKLLTSLAYTCGTLADPKILRLFLPVFASQPESAWATVGALARVYPAQAAAIAEAIWPFIPKRGNP
jgi:hypothetical protein